MREIEVGPTKAFNGRIEPNDPVRVYDCSGPWGDPDYQGNVDAGLRWRCAATGSRPGLTSKNTMAAM